MSDPVTVTEEVVNVTVQEQSTPVTVMETATPVAVQEQPTQVSVQEQLTQVVVMGGGGGGGGGGGLTGVPVTSADEATSVAAGGQAVLKSAQVSPGRTGTLVRVIVTSTVPFKAVLQPVDGGVPGPLWARGVELTEFEWWTAQVGFNRQGYTGTIFDGFQITVTNLDPGLPADIYATFDHVEN